MLGGGAAAGLVEGREVADMRELKRVVMMKLER